MKLGKEDHRALALWAADCAEHVLSAFETRYPKDDRPRKALEAGRAWALGTRGRICDSPPGSVVTVAQVRQAAFAAHAAAREADDPAARAAARAAGHAAATVHVADHARYAAAYAVKAVAYAAVPTDADAAATKEREWQVRHLPKHLRSVAFPARGNS